MLKPQDCQLMSEERLRVRPQQDSLTSTSTLVDQTTSMLLCSESLSQDQKRDGNHNVLFLPFTSIKVETLIN